ncbi:MAG: hypothetical protein BA862_08295 [Desulfobulbaceae bacterium S3730MH12]|nr:MAG: hypothetical protein BA866_03650 [Desulfobulbaceae bacterium S5133MH15]OEU56405.1 MAG: hypothetical protein BA862_08295 [Desulfobulbaceae bacterium S3730MH12]OEU82340.1 MAG: hypothetical protein BA873_09075 [Desulfobulbaceae bacterium C00003063]
MFSRIFYRKKYGFFLTDLSKVERLRIDTHQYAGTASLGLDSLIPFQQVEEYRVDESGLWLRSSGNDPSFELIPELHPAAIDKSAWVAELTFVFLA